MPAVIAGQAPPVLEADGAELVPLADPTGADPDAVTTLPVFDGVV
jgi:hypothetical protein